MSLRILIIPTAVVILLWIIIEILYLHQPQAQINPTISCHLSTSKNLTKLLFAHFPKTGGTTFVQEILYQHLNIPAICDKPYEFCLSHTMIGMMRYRGFNLTHWLLSDTFSITLLRHPIDRLLSEYYYNRSPISRGQLLAINQTLDEFLNQTQQTFHQTSYIGTFGQGNLNQALLTLNNFDLIGTTDQFDEFVTAFAMYFNLPPAAMTYQKYRVMLDRPEFADLSPKQQSTINKLIADDLTVYNYAKTLFDRQTHNTNFEQCFDQQQAAQSQISDECLASDIAHNHGQMHRCYKTVR